MRRPTKAEAAAAAAVLSAAGGVAVSGIKLMKKHAEYLTRKAAAAFPDEEDEKLIWPDHVSWEQDDISADMADVSDTE